MTAAAADDLIPRHRAAPTQPSAPVLRALPFANWRLKGIGVLRIVFGFVWLIDAWWSLGRRDDAKELFEDALRHRNRYGLLSEDVDPQSGALCGNFPQTYSMAGLILTAMRLSRSWEDRYWR